MLVMIDMIQKNPEPSFDTLKSAQKVYPTRGLPEKSATMESPGSVAYPIL